MTTVSQLFEKNRTWAARMLETEPDLFPRLAQGQSPEFLWIGCADSRVPAGEIMGLAPGELFVHRNIANLVIDADLSCLSVLQYAVDILKVKHVIVCGHYDCGGVKAAIGDHPHGLVDNWLRHVRDVQRRWSVELFRLSTPQKKLDRLCELNAIQQVMNVGNTTVLQQAWQRGQKVAVHGWMYSIATGLLKDLDVSVTSVAELERMQDRETSAGRA